MKQVTLRKAMTKDAKARAVYFGSMEEFGAEITHAYRKVSKGKPKPTHIDLGRKAEVDALDARLDVLYATKAGVQDEILHGREKAAEEIAERRYAAEVDMAYEERDQRLAMDVASEVQMMQLSEELSEQRISSEAERTREVHNLREEEQWQRDQEDFDAEVVLDEKIDAADRHVSEQQRKADALGITVQDLLTKDASLTGAVAGLVRKRGELTEEVGNLEQRASTIEEDLLARERVTEMNIEEMLRDADQEKEERLLAADAEVENRLHLADEEIRQREEDAAARITSREQAADEGITTRTEEAEQHVRELEVIAGTVKADIAESERRVEELTTVEQEALERVTTLAVRERELTESVTTLEQRADAPIDPALEAERANPMIEKAKEILGKDFLGVEAIRNMEEKLKGIGVDVEFVIDQLPPFPYTEMDLEFAKEIGEMLVMRPHLILLNGREQPLVFGTFHKLMRQDPLKQGKIFNNEESRVSGEMLSLGWTLVKKKTIGDINRKQNDLVRKYEDNLKGKGVTNAEIRRRTSFETAWDTVLYYIYTGEKLLTKVCDLGESKVGVAFGPSGTYTYYLSVGNFNANGLHLESISDIHPHSNLEIGFCPQR